MLLSSPTPGWTCTGTLRSPLLATTEFGMPHGLGQRAPACVGACAGGGDIDLCAHDVDALGTGIDVVEHEPGDLGDVVGQCSHARDDILQRCYVDRLAAAIALEQR